MNGLKTLFFGLLAVMFLSFNPNQAEARKKQGTRTHAKRAPLSVRMNNPCAISYGYKRSSPGKPTPAFMQAVMNGIPAAAGQKDSIGNTVIKFSKWEDGTAACRLFLRKSMYAKLDIADAIRSWSGGNSHKAYAGYVTRRTGLPLHGRKIRSLTDHELSLFIQAKSEWESGRTQPGTLTVLIRKGQATARRG